MQIKINKTKILMLTMCTMLFTLTACESSEQIQQRKETESAETLERLEDKYDKEFKLLDSDYSRGECTGGTFTFKIKCKDDNTVFYADSYSDSYIFAKHEDEIMDAINEMYEDAARNSNITAIKYIGIDQDDLKNTIEITTDRVDENTSVDELVDIILDKHKTIIIEPNTTNKQEFRESLLPFIECLPDTYCDLTNKDKTVTYKSIYDTSSVKINNEQEWLDKWYE